MLAVRRKWHYFVIFVVATALIYTFTYIYGQFQVAVSTLPRSLHQCLGFQPPKVDQIIRSVIVDNKESAQMITRPLIFVGGVPRSGTTLMRVLLDAHPDIRCGEETRVVTRLLSMRYNWEIREIERKRLDAAGLNLTVLDDATRSFITEVILNHGPPAEYYCNKDPLNFKYLTTLTRLYPNGKYILMIRDGRAVAHSIVARNVTIGGVDTKSYLSAVAFWNKALTNMLEQCKAVGEKKCMKIYYEQLVVDIEKWMRKILEFVDIPWHPNVLRHHELISSKEISLSKMEPSTNQVKQPVYKNAIDKWREVIPKNLQKTMYKTAPLLQQLGYK